MRKRVVRAVATLVLCASPPIHAGLSPQGPEFPVNTHTADRQWYPTVAMDPSANFVIVWSSKNQDGDGDGIFGRRFDAAGVAAGGEFQANTYTSNGQFQPEIAMDATGRFVVVWFSANQDGSANGIFGRRFDAGGAPLGPEFQVKTYTTGNQTYPSVSMNPAGKFVVTWASYQDGSAYGVFGQRFDKDGVADGIEFQVNVQTLDYQLENSVAMQDDGGFLTTWMTGVSWPPG